MTAHGLARKVLAEAGMRGYSTRIAAVLARAELERMVDAAVLAREPGMAAATQRSKLIYLRYLDRNAGALADTAYAGLSGACHQHAYELSPTESEVRHLLDLVDQIASMESGGGK